MENVTIDQIEMMVELQKDETAISRIKEYFKEVPAMFDAFDGKLIEFENEQKEKENVFKEMKKKYRDNEAEVQMNLEKGKKKDIQLMSIKSNKEYQAILNEIEDIKTRNSKLEDEMIEFLDILEEKEKNLSKEKAEFSLIKEQIFSEKKLLEEECEKKRKELAVLEENWKKNSEKIEPELLKRYNAIRERIGGAAIAAAKNAVCQACFMNIPPQMYNELYKYETLRFCPNCHRIIYVMNG